MSFKAGFVTIIGRPNVGKSSIINAIVGEKVSIVSPKAQTTRNTILGILNLPDAQIVFTDTPGMNVVNNRLDSFMQKSISSARALADVLVYVLDGTKPFSQEELNVVRGLENVCDNVILVVNKTDLSTFEKLYPKLNKLNDLTFLKEIIPVSAFKHSNINVLIEKIKNLLPEGEAFYDDDIYTNKSLKFMVAEIIREKALWLLQEEIPHGIGVEIVKFTEGDVLKIDADLVCEKQSHKQIIVGHEGQTIKNIGTQAREDIEKLCGSHVFLNLFVKVRPDWRNKTYYVNDLGYNTADLE